MKKVASIFVLLNLLNFSWVQAADLSDPEVVSSVDLNRYAGYWYDIAHAPNFFQRGCVRSTAEYAVLSPLSVSVKNTCYKEDGSISDIDGEAKVVNPEVPTKLKVRFNFFARGDYWIVDLDPDYQWSVVSGPEKKSLFILSRQAPMDPQVLAQIVDRLKQRGFKTDDLIYGQY
ncbi:lipocalin family protein [Bdellovibrio sp.]|uniref:lipocalin family protein n=1 Tax=Bdellovibrio sp. TaxID=28201 RepID=UPI0039E521C4